MKDKYFTKYKNFFIEAWYGLYLLEGNADYLSFLYDAGLGSKNAQGFGMFEIKKVGRSHNDFAVFSKSPIL